MTSLHYHCMTPHHTSFIGSVSQYKKEKGEEEERNEAGEGNEMEGGLCNFSLCKPRRAYCYVSMYLFGSFYSILKFFWFLYSFFEFISASTAVRYCKYSGLHTAVRCLKKVFTTTLSRDPTPLDLFPCSCIFHHNNLS
jgi:hypothetical protein